MTAIRTTNEPRVLMVGPALCAKGGMATVVHEYIKAGIADSCTFEYVETTGLGGVISKVIAAFRAYVRFCFLLPTYDIVHIHVGAGISQRRKMIFAKTAKMVGKRVIIHEHRGTLCELYRTKGAPFSKKCRAFYELADIAIVLSEEWKFFFEENVCKGSKTRVLHNSVASPDGDLSFGSAERVLFLGHMTDVKGPDILIRAIPDVLKVHPACSFIFAGDGDKAPYERLAEKLGVKGSCEFTGWVDAAYKDMLLRTCPIYCQPSRYEGMPMALLEAMGYGRACVATQVGGVPQIILNGSNGFLVDPLDSVALAKRICFLISNFSFAKTIGARARITVCNNFNSKKNLDCLFSIYEELLTRESA